VGFANGENYVTFYVQPRLGVDMKAIFVNGATVVSEKTQTINEIKWNLLDTSYRTRLGRRLGSATYYVSAFSTEYMNSTYYGYIHSQDTTSGDQVIASFLQGTKPKTQVSDINSLTGPDYSGKKFYLGFGDLLDGEMGNEVKYDVKHTNDIFTKSVGGDYNGTSFISEYGGDDKVRSYWDGLKSVMGNQDMYVEYSSGHGSQSGLMFGLSYSEIANNALAMPAREVVVFIMSCYSGNLVDRFNDKKSQWEDWQSKGRTLMVFASAHDDEESSTGPGTDPDEPEGPDGSAGSAFGWALWKALIGYSDGYLDGVKDGFITLDEIIAHTTVKTEQVGGQTPIATGAYNGNLIMNRVPPKRFIDSLMGGTEGMTNAEIRHALHDLDRGLKCLADTA